MEPDAGNAQEQIEGAVLLRWRSWRHWFTLTLCQNRMKPLVLLFIGVAAVALGALLFFWTDAAGDENATMKERSDPESSLSTELKQIFDGQNGEGGEVDVDGVLAAFSRLMENATPEDLPELLKAIRLPENNFWTRELLSEPIAALGGASQLEPLFDAFEKGRNEGHDNDRFQAVLIGIAEADPEECRAALEALLTRDDFPHTDRAEWLLTFCK